MAGGAAASAMHCKDSNQFEMSFGHMYIAASVSDYLNADRNSCDLSLILPILVKRTRVNSRLAKE